MPLERAYLPDFDEATGIGRSRAGSGHDSNLDGESASDGKRGGDSFRTNPLVPSS